MFSGEINIIRINQSVSFVNNFALYNALIDWIFLSLNLLCFIFEIVEKLLGKDNIYYRLTLIKFVSQDASFFYKRILFQKNTICTCNCI